MNLATPTLNNETSLDKIAKDCMVLVREMNVISSGSNETVEKTIETFEFLIEDEEDRKNIRINKSTSSHQHNLHLNFPNTNEVTSEWLRTRDSR